MADKQPKLDFKMFLLPGILLLTRKINFKNTGGTDEANAEGTRNILLAQQGLVAVGVLMATLYYYLFTRIRAQSNKDVKIWVPPKAKPALPFGLGPPAEEEKASDYEETSYSEYEMKLLKEAAGGMCFSVGISLFMSFKFNVHVSLLMQGISLPMNAIDFPLIKKYLLGFKTKGELGARIYNEELKKPTDEYLLKKKALAAEVSKSIEHLSTASTSASAPVAVTAEATAASSSSSSKACLPGEPRVEELPADSLSGIDE